jgi:hypothetical protein
MNQELSFFNQRMLPLGLTDDNNYFEVKDEEAEFPRPSTYKIKVFSEDEAGNILIVYWTIQGELITYVKMGDGKTSHLNGKVKNYTIKRLKEPKGDMKYQMPTGQGTHPWFPPALVEKFKKGERIETLYLTEGVFKAWRAQLDGVDMVGLTSITHYMDSETRGIHSDIAKLIEVCEVQNVVILWDGDCLNISEKDLTRRDPITRRPKGFFNAAKKISQLIAKIKFKKTRHHPSVFFMHPKSDMMPNKPKGIDDVLIEPELQDKKPAILHDLKAIKEEGYWFYKANITESTQGLWRYFALDDAKVFFQRHELKIGVNEWYFHDDKYKYNDEKNELELLVPGWATSIRWIGDDFFVERLIPGASTDRRKLIPIKATTLKQLYGNDYMNYIRQGHHVAFCNVPNHFDYEQVIIKEDKKFYNRYFPFRHVPAEGRYPKTLEFIKHIFGDYDVNHAPTGNKIKSWELGLDYIQLLLCHPTQILPVLCLYSPENNTGKSTFGKLLLSLFGDNAVLISNHDLQSEFNDTFSDKLLAICEETLLERKKEAERIKALSTQPQILVNTKGVAAYSIDFFCKFQFYSNNKRMIYVTKHDERFWIIQVPKAKGDNPKLLDEMRQEIPAFIKHLRERKMATENESRMHFHPSLVRTKAFEETVKVNEPQEATNIREEIKDMFLLDSEIETIEMTMKDIQKEFFTAKANQKWITEILKDYLNIDLERDDNGIAVPRRGKYIKHEMHEINFGGETRFEIRAVEKPTKGRHYVFHRKDFVSNNETSFIDTDNPEKAKEASAFTTDLSKNDYPPTWDEAKKNEHTFVT